MPALDEYENELKAWEAAIELLCDLPYPVATRIVDKAFAEVLEKLDAEVEQ